MQASASSGGYTGVSTTGCGGCHGAAADAGITLSLSGQQILAPGAPATYTLTASKSGVNTQPFGLNVSTTDGSGLTTIMSQSTQKLGEEITHTNPPKTMSGSPTASGNYQFTFTMPAAAAAGSDHTLRAALAIDYTGGWKLATYTVYVMPVAPTSVSASGATLGSVNLSWSGGGPQYRVVYKVGPSAPTSTTDGTATDVGAITSTTISGLTSGTEYSFAVYSKVAGAAIYSTTAGTTTASTNSSSVSFVATSVAVGGNHTCALTGAGAVKCWGANGSGQLGNNSTAQETLAVGVSGLGSGVVAIAAGFHHTCALTTGGGVKCWGRNDLGQLGDGSSTQRLTPVDVSGLTSGVAAIAAGFHHTCALTAAGGVKCWGQGTSGQLGDNAGVNRLAPVDVSGLASGVMAIAGGGSHSCGVTTGGAAKCWGANGSGQLGDNTTTQRLVPVDVSGLASGVAGITAGGGHTCARTSGGAAKCWGGNTYGQVGDNSQTDRQVPTDVAGLATGVAGIDATGLNTCALTTNGAIRCWGNNGNGGIGDGTQLVDRLVPTAVFGLSSGMTAASAGGHSCALTIGGGIRCWGNNFNGQLGDGSSGNVRPFPVDVVQFAGGVMDAAAGGNHTCAVTAEGGARCWGNNGTGQVGDNTTTQRVTPTDVVGLLRGVAAISTGFQHSCALTTGGGVKCWGANSNGELGDGSSTQRLTPVDVSGLTSGVAAITAGFRHTCALMASGGVKCWGEGISGQLGDNATTNRQVPVDVSGLASGVSAISAGAGHTCALTASGGLKCWGANDSGQLGDNTTTQRLVPVDVSGLTSGVAELAVGSGHTCARTTAGGVKCWGSNTYGQIGDNTQVNRHSPVDVSGLTSGVAGLAAGSLQNCVITNAGGLKCWGNNGNGGIGDNTQANNRLVPTDVLYLTTGMAVVSPGNHTCAFSFSGALSCWGNNFNGQLGDGATTNRPTPLGVLGLGGGTHSIAFAPPATGSVGAPINLSATATSGLAVLFDTWTPTTCSVSGNTVTPSAPGICGVRAVQGGNTVHPAAAKARLIVISAATTLTYNLVLEGWQQVSPYVVTSATGTGTATFNTTTKVLTLNLPYSGLSSSETGAHIHGPAARGANAGVLFSLAGANPKTDSVTLSAAQETQLNAGQLYVNIHTSTYPNGELRAQIDNLGATVTRALTVTKTGTGTGTVTGTAEPGIVINCGSDCAETVPNGKTVTLTAAAASGSTFTSWSGGGCTGAGGCTVTLSAVTTVTATFSNPPRLANISTRMAVLTGDNVLIGGFIIGGSSSKTIVVRARGPSLTALGVPNALANPVLSLFSGQTVIASNDDFATAANAAQLQASGFAPSNAQEAAILITLNPGPYTAIVTGAGGTTGVGIIEVFEVDAFTVPLINIATRGPVLTGDNVMIGGFIIQGSGPQTVVVRARGPSLTAAGVPNALANPVLSLFSGQTVIASNDDWQTASNAAALQSSGFAPANAQESAILITLNPGAYTAIVTGAGGTTGVGIIEVFAVP